jgi:hypothetical protein
VTAKKSPAACDGRALKAETKNLYALYSASAFQSQTLNFQAVHVARRFGLSANMAAIVASLAWGTAR